MKHEFPCYGEHHGINGSPVPQDNLRLELNPNEFKILSYHHFEIAGFESAKSGDTLTISFLNHQVRITGKNLRPLALALQDRAVVFIKLVPARYGLVLEDNAAAVESIEVEKAE
jgi:hypothetical protein